MIDDDIMETFLDRNKLKFHRQLIQEAFSRWVKPECAVLP